MYNSLRQSGSLLRHSLHKCVFSVRSLVVLVLLLIFFNETIAPVRQFCADVGVNITPFIYPFISSYWFNSLILLMGIAFLFSDAPSYTDLHPFLMVRSSKSAWLTSQYLYILCVSALYAIIMAMIVNLLMIPHLELSGDWGRVIHTLAQTDAGMQYEVGFSISYALIVAYSPWEALGLSLLTTWLNGVLMGSVIFVINMAFNKAVGTAVAVFLIMMTVFTLNSSGYFYYYVSPFTWLYIGHLDIAGNTQLPTVAYALAIYCALTLILFIIGFALCRKRDIDAYIYG